jgi:iron(III) transport system ATP-binding protein
VREGDVLVSPIGRALLEAVHLPFDLDDGGRVVLAVRPECVRLCAMGQGVAGRVVGRRFLGDLWRVDVAVEGLDAPLVVRLHEREAPPLKAEIGVAFEACDLLVFAE